VKRAVLPLAGAALLVVAAALRLPRPYSLLRLDANPFRRTLSPHDGHIYALAEAAAPAIPVRARIAVECAPERPQETAYCVMVVRGLLPGRDVRGVPREADWRPDFLIREGKGGEPAGGRLLFRIADGEIWRFER
jgi:hypothetical protein